MVKWHKFINRVHTMSLIYLHQIYYDDISRQQISPLCIPIDNAGSLHPDWFEFWVIKQFLDNNTLDENAFYGFLSPKFSQKTGYEIADVLATVQNHAAQFDVFLLTGKNAWEHITAFLNPFEQGDVFHRGLWDLSVQLAQRLGWRQPAQLVCSTHNFTFCNYIIAKPSYWRMWQQYANALFDYCASSDEPLAHALRQTTRHTNNGIHYAFKVFVQERLPAWILQDSALRVAVLEDMEVSHLFGFPATPNVLHVLQTCNLLKQAYGRDGNVQHLHAFEHLRCALIGVYPERWG